MQPDYEKVSQKLAIQVANLSLENAKLVAVLEQLQAQAQEAEKEEEK